MNELTLKRELLLARIRLEREKRIFRNRHVYIAFSTTDVPRKIRDLFGFSWPGSAVLYVYRSLRSSRKIARATRFEKEKRIFRNIYIYIPRLAGRIEKNSKRLWIFVTPSRCTIRLPQFPSVVRHVKPQWSRALFMFCLISRNKRERVPLVFFSSIVKSRFFHRVAVMFVVISVRCLCCRLVSCVENGRGHCCSSERGIRRNVTKVIHIAVFSRNIFLLYNKYIYTFWFKTKNIFVLPRPAIKHFL